MRRAAQLFVPSIRVTMEQIFELRWEQHLTPKQIVQRLSLPEGEESAKAVAAGISRFKSTVAEVFRDTIRRHNSRATEPELRDMVHALVATMIRGGTG